MAFNTVFMHVKFGKEEGLRDTAMYLMEKYGRFNLPCICLLVVVAANMLLCRAGFGAGVYYYPPTHCAWDGALKIHLKVTRNESCMKQMLL